MLDSVATVQTSVDAAHSYFTDDWLTGIESAYGVDTGPAGRPPMELRLSRRLSETK